MQSGQSRWLDCGFGASRQSSCELQKNVRRQNAGGRDAACCVSICDRKQLSRKCTASCVFWPTNIAGGSTDVASHVATTDLLSSPYWRSSLSLYSGRGRSGIRPWHLPLLYRKQLYYLPECAPSRRDGFP